MSNFGSQVKYNFGDHYTNGQQSINASQTLAPASYPSLSPGHCFKADILDLTR